MANPQPLYVAEKRGIIIDDLTTLDDPIFQGTADVAAAVRNFLARDMDFFSTIERRIRAMSWIWDIILEQKRRYDDSQDGSIPDDRSRLETLLFCGRMVAVKLETIPTARMLLSLDLGANIPSPLPDPMQLDIPTPLQTHSYLEPPPTRTQIMPMDKAPTQEAHGHDKIFTARSMRMQKRAFSDMAGHNRHEDGPERKRKKLKLEETNRQDKRVRGRGRGNAMTRAPSR